MNEKNIKVTRIDGGGGVSLQERPTPCSRFTADRKSTRLNSSHLVISYAVFCLKKQRDHLLSPFRLERLFLVWHKSHHSRPAPSGHLFCYVREMLLASRPLSRPYLNPRRLLCVD